MIVRICRGENEEKYEWYKILDRLITIIVSYSIAFSIFALATTAVVYGKWLYYFEIDF